MSLVKHSVNFEFKASPIEELSSEVNLSMRRPISGEKLRNIREMY